MCADENGRPGRGAPGDAIEECLRRVTVAAATRGDATAIRYAAVCSSALQVAVFGVEAWTTLTTLGQAASVAEGQGRPGAGACATPTDRPPTVT